jgi:hypothetical protein
MSACAWLASSRPNGTPIAAAAASEIVAETRFERRPRPRDALLLLLLPLLAAFCRGVPEGKDLQSPDAEDGV